jgi:hypothetical protein
MSPLFYLKTMPPAVQVGKNDFPVLVKGGKGELNRDPALLTVMIRSLITPGRGPRNSSLGRNLEYKETVEQPRGHFS